MEINLNEHMVKVQVRFSEKQIELIDEFMRMWPCANRSEAIRLLVTQSLRQNKVVAK